MIRRSVLPGAFTLAMMLAGATNAFAEPRSDTSVAERQEPAPGRVERSWYGWQVLAVDGAATGLFITAAASRSRPVFTSGIFVYALSAPAVHAFHARPWPGVGSLALRVVAPGLLGLIGYATVSCRSDYADEAQGAECTDTRRTRGTLGLIVGGVIATTVDASLLAFELRPVRRAGLVDEISPYNVAVMPVLSPSTLGVAARATF